jgi:hypothetical protein
MLFEALLTNADAQLLTKREFEGMVAEAAVKRRLAVHFDAVDLLKPAAVAFV